MSLDIDPTQITQDNVPQVLGAIVVELQNMNHKLDEHMEELTDSVNERINALTERVTSIEENNVVHPNCTTHLETLKRLESIEKTLSLHDTLFWTPLLVTKDDMLYIYLKRDNDYTIVYKNEIYALYRVVDNTGTT